MSGSYSMSSSATTASVAAPSSSAHFSRCAEAALQAARRSARSLRHCSTEAVQRCSSCASECCTLRDVAIEAPPSALAGSDSALEGGAAAGAAAGVSAGSSSAAAGELSGEPGRGRPAPLPTDANSTLTPHQGLVRAHNRSCRQSSPAKGLLLMAPLIVELRRQKSATGRLADEGIAAEAEGWVTAVRQIRFGSRTLLTLICCVKW
jgi:hypothetical protein